MSAIVVAAAVAVALLALGRWGLRNAGTLSTAAASPEKRRREEASVRRGSWSCLALGSLFGVLAAVSGIGSATGIG